MQDKIGVFHLSGYTRLAENQRFHRLRLQRYASLDCLVAFCASLLAPNEKGMMPSLGQSAATAVQQGRLT
jgi:hypothetical protein